MRRFRWSWGLAAAAASGSPLLAPACSMPDYRLMALAGGQAGGITQPHCENTLWERELGESDFDCGGGCAACALGKNCDRAADCYSETCEQGICVPPPLAGGPGMAGVGGGGSGGSNNAGGCDAGGGECNGSAGEVGCPGPLGTTTDCSRCGESCQAATPFCAATGCVDHLELQIGGPSQHAMQVWNGTGDDAVVRVDHELMHARGSARLVLVGVAASGPFPETLGVLYDDTPMSLLVERIHASNQARAAIFYLLDDELPANAGLNEVSVTFNQDQAWGHGGFDVLELTNALQAAPTLSASSEAANCDAPTTRGVTLNFEQPGSLVYGVLAVRGPKSLPVLLQTPAVTESWNERALIGDDPLSGSTAWVFDDDTRTLNWSLASCYNDVAVAAAVQRLTALP